MSARWHVTLPVGNISRCRHPALDGKNGDSLKCRKRCEKIKGSFHQDDVVTGKRVLHEWPFMRGIRRWPMVPLTKGPQCRALAFLSLASHKLLNKQPTCRRFMTQLDSLFNLNNKESIKALHYIDGLAQACSNAMELQQSCTKPSICLRDRNPPVTRNASNDNRVTMSWHHHGRKQFRIHYNYVIMGAIGSQITSLTIVYLIVYSDADQRILRTNGQLRGKCFHLMTSSWQDIITRKQYMEASHSGGYLFWHINSGNILSISCGSIDRIRKKKYETVIKVYWVYCAAILFADKTVDSVAY